MGFHNDLEFGEEGEQVVIDDYASHGWACVEQPRDYRFDFLMVHTDGDALKVEVKRDRKAAQTGNLFIEYECRGKDSGIMTSEADVWTFVIGDDSLLSIFTPELKALCKGARSVSGGDNHTTKGYLVKVDDVRPCTAARDEIRR